MGIYFYKKNDKNKAVHKCGICNGKMKNPGVDFQIPSFSNDISVTGSLPVCEKCLMKHTKE